MKKLLILIMSLFCGSLLFTHVAQAKAQEKIVLKEESKSKSGKNKGKMNVNKPKGEKLGKVANPDKGDDDDYENVEEESEVKKKDAAKGLEKQGAKKATRFQKESGKGSEKGQEARSKRKKWWKFWDRSE